MSTPGARGTQSTSPRPMKTVLSFQHLFRFRFYALIAAGSAFLFMSYSPAFAADVDFYGVLKGQRFVQTNAGPATADSASNVVLNAFVSQKGQGVVTNALVRAPNSTVLPLGGGGGGNNGEAKVFFSSIGELDAAFPNGSYTVEIGTVNDGNRTNALLLTGDAYPVTPHFSNFNAAQAIDPAASFTLNWDALSGTTSNDFLQIQIMDCTGNKVVETSPPGQPGSFNGAATAFLIPARALRPGQQYDVELLLARFVTFPGERYLHRPGRLGAEHHHQLVRRPRRLWRLL